VRETRRTLMPADRVRVSRERQEARSMADYPTVVGINRTQDGSISVARGPATVYSLQKERVTRRKHHWGRLGDLPERYLPRLPQLREPVDLVVEGYSSDSEVEGIADYHEELLATLTFRDEPELARVSHHLSHVYSAFPPSPFETAAVMIVDAQGSRAGDVTEPYPAAPGTDPNLLEVASFYRADRRDGRYRIECVGKHLWHGDWSEPAGLGCFYSLLTRTMFSGEGAEGKVMGLAPFGTVGSLGLPELEVRGCEVHIPRAWLETFAQRDRFSHFLGGGGSFEECANLAAEGQHTFEEAVLKLAEWVHRQTGTSQLCFAGGTALNCSANGRVLRESSFSELFIPPSAHDGGTALGCALYGLIECLGQPSEFRWENDFLGPDPDPAALDRAVRAVGPDLEVQRPDTEAELIARAVELLSSGRVVGLHQGRSESGPRALGNRSILGDARHPGMLNFINSKVKGREWFRPLAPLVLAEHAKEIFEVDRPSPFMLLAAQVRPEHRAGLPAITHVDGSARLQTVEPVQTPFLHALLAAFADRTGCPVLLNTSLNGPGDPLAETPEDSLACLTQTNMHALLMPPYLVRKRVEPELPNPADTSPWL
jgi:carbamoyltransferase